MKRLHYPNHGRQQKRIPGLIRQDIWGTIDPDLRQWVEREARREDCSLSLVVNTALSYASGIPLEVEQTKTKPSSRVLKMKRSA